MKNKVIVISLGGSLILSPQGSQFLLAFRKILKKNYRKNKFVIVCGGGSIARQYINVLKKEGKTEKELSMAGIRATRMNAQFVMQVFGKEANDMLPVSMKGVKNNLKKNKVVVCGALRYDDKETSDGTAAKLANYLRTNFINITNVKGLYTADPKYVKNARFIPYESWGTFAQRAEKIRYKSGQHFVLDQSAAELIKKKKIITYIIGSNLRNLNALLEDKKFAGTTIGP